MHVTIQRIRIALFLPQGPACIFDLAIFLNKHSICHMFILLKVQCVPSSKLQAAKTQKETQNAYARPIAAAAAAAAAAVYSLSTCSIICCHHPNKRSLRALVVED